jgi:signal transduction histidine kinase
VQASNNDRLWNEEGVGLTLVIAAPFYRRTWFFGLAGLGVLPILFGWHRVRVSKLRARYVGMFTERGRVARELHDTILQGMSGIAMQLGAIRMRRADLPEEHRRELDGLQDTVVQCLEECRRAVWDLRDAARESDLGAALARFARRLFRGPAIRCEVAVEGKARHLPTSVEDELFRIAQEALRNAATHAGARTVTVRLRYLTGEVALAVSDDGRGFDPDGEQRAGHFGVAGMRERAARIGGSLSVRSTPDAGTTVEVVAPTKPS